MRIIKSLLILLPCIWACSKPKKSNIDVPKAVDAYEIGIRFFIDESAVDLTDGSLIYLVNEKDTIQYRIEDNRIFITDSTQNWPVVTLIFQKDNYSLVFENTDSRVLIPDQSIEWHFGIDKKPFDAISGTMSHEELEKDTITREVHYWMFMLQEHGDGIMFRRKK